MMAELRARCDAGEANAAMGERAAAVAELEAESAQDGFWDDADAAQALIQRLNAQKRVLARVAGWHADLEDAATAVELCGEATTSTAEAAVLRDEAATTLRALGRDVDAFELESQVGCEASIIIAWEPN